MSEEAQPLSEPSVGEQIAGKYRLERLLGRGGMGVVYAARNLELDERVAIKLLGRAQTPELASRFVGEAKAAARIHSDHVVRIYDVGRTGSGAPYIVMEYLEGRDLGEVIDKGGPSAPAAAVAWILEACEALAEAHSLGFVHRDLKPENLFLARRTDGSSRIKLLDFGIAKVPSSLALTQTNHLMGSPVYMAPEQLASSRTVDARADIWGLGVVLYELLTAEAPFAADSVLELALKVRGDPHRRVTELRPDVPAGLSAVVDRCLEKSRDQRFPDIAALAQALELYASPDSGSLVRRIERIARGPSDHATLDEPAASRPDSAPERTTASQATMAALTRSTVLELDPPKKAKKRSRFVALGAATLGVAVAGFAAQRNFGAETQTTAAAMPTSRSAAAIAPPAAPAMPTQTTSGMSNSSATMGTPSPPIASAVQKPRQGAALNRRKPKAPAAESSALSSAETGPAAAAPVAVATPLTPPMQPPSEPTAKKRVIDRSRPW